MAKIWQILERERSNDDMGFREEEHELRKMFTKGFRKGYEKAMKEAEEHMGFRDDDDDDDMGFRGEGGSGMGNRGGRSNYRGNGSDMGFKDELEQEAMRSFKKEMGERRRRRSNGEFY